MPRKKGTKSKDRKRKQSELAFTTCRINPQMQLELSQMPHSCNVVSCVGTAGRGISPTPST
eukprot:3629334-Amphidinium_carterae.1